MKLSLLWLHEHIDMLGTHSSILDHADEIVTRLGRSTAEVEGVDHIAVDLSSFFLGKPHTLTTDSTIVRIPELSRDIKLPLRADLCEHSWYLLFQESPHEHRFATVHDLSPSSQTSVAITRDTLLPAFFIPDQEGTGSWKRLCEPCDVRISIDNKSINHRADLWSHYGMAREVAALMGWKLKPLEGQQLTSHPQPTSLLRVETSTCDRFARIDLCMASQPSLPWMALRLLRVGQRPITAPVDLTNYVMFDIGQPLHVFDATKVHGPLVVRQAHRGEILTLLDGTELNLQHADCVVADEQHPLSLAGIKGGKDSGISASTHTVILESAHFAPQAIRHSSQVHRIRTEGSTRWEKGVDRTNVITAVQRFVLLAEKYHLIAPQEYQVALWDAHGAQSPQMTDLSHAHLERKVGMTFSENTVYNILNTLGFSVSSQKYDDKLTYDITVPSWRIGDVSIPEDIIEEIARIRGYDAIKGQLPPRTASLFDTRPLQTSRSISHHLAHGLRMQEVKSYPFFDEQFVQSAQLDIENAASVRNPVSLQWRRLVTSLIPHLVRHGMSNLPEEEELRLFEINTTWALEKGALTERKKLAWIWYSHQKELDFYAGKQMVMALLDVLRLSCVWRAAPPSVHPWWHVPHTATLHYGVHEVGCAGILKPAFLRRIVEGSCFGVELDFEFLTNHRPSRTLYEAPSKYPTIATDISMLASYSVPATEIMHHIEHLDTHVQQVYLVDFFEKKSWHNKRSLTIRIICGNPLRTMTHEEARSITQKIIDSLVHTFQVEMR